MHMYKRQKMNKIRYLISIKVIVVKQNKKEKNQHKEKLQHIRNWKTMTIVH